MGEPLQHDPRPPLLQIGDVAEQVGLSLRTVRYYEEVGLISPAARSEGGFRLYSDREVRRLTIVKRMRALALTLEEMGRLLQLIEDGDRAHALSKGELRELVEGLREYADRSDKAISRVERDLVQAHQLRIRIAEHLTRCETLLGPR